MPLAAHGAGLDDAQAAQVEDEPGRQAREGCGFTKRQVTLSHGPTVVQSTFYAFALVWVARRLLLFSYRRRIW